MACAAGGEHAIHHVHADGRRSRGFARACRRPLDSAGDRREGFDAASAPSFHTSCRAIHRRPGRQWRSRKIESDEASAFSRRSSACVPPCTMPKSIWREAWPLRAKCFRERRAQSRVRRGRGRRRRAIRRGFDTLIEDHDDVGAERDLDMSSVIPGERECSEPSMCERNVTPSSATLRKSGRLKTW